MKPDQLKGWEPREDKMTLYASVEKMKAALYSTAKRRPTSHGSPQRCQEALDAAPAQAMSEDEIFDVMLKTWETTGGSFIALIRALRDAGCLYVKEVER